jgi:hypothetical protein
VIRALVELVADINFAVEKGYINVIRGLAELGANISAAANTGFTPLHNSLEW